MDKIAKEDIRFFNESGDGFNLERNKAVIEGTIKKYEANRARKIKEFRDKLGERADALAFYFKSPHFGFGKSPVEHYFGRRTVAYLRGDEVRHELMGNVIQKDTVRLYRQLNAKEQKKGKA